MSEGESAQRRIGQDNQPRAFGLADDLKMGLRFYSRLPAGEAPHVRPSLNRIAMALPFASLVIGIGPALLLIALAFATVPPYLAAALAVTAMVLVTGGMAEDALADSADGLGGGMDRERRLEIMRDSRHGTYGVAALCLFLVARVAALGAVAAVNPLAAGATWLAATVLARSGALSLALVLPSARSDGASAGVGRIGKRRFGAGLVFAVLLGFVFAAPFARVIGLVVGLLLVALLAVLWARLCKTLVGGQTGDLIGALQALMEIALLTAFAGFAT